MTKTIRNGSRVVTLSDDELFRYFLAEFFVPSPTRMLVFLMLNPSKADHMIPDPTSAKIFKWAKDWGYDSGGILNLFALRSTDPNVLYSGNNVIGPENDSFISYVTAVAARVVCGWGKHGKLMNRDRDVLALLRRQGVTPYAMHVNKDGTPKHPLYIANVTVPKELKLAA